jgi:alpha-beta hydrolase superfamily lysophospholipase
MYARWASFAIGLGLLLAPLALGYGSAARILHDVAMGALVCIATLAALEWPLARFVLAAPAVWLLLAGRSSADPSAAVVELAAGVLLLVLAAIPSARFAPPSLRRRRAGARA